MYLPSLQSIFLLGTLLATKAKGATFQCDAVFGNGDCVFSCPAGQSCTSSLAIPGVDNSPCFSKACETSGVCTFHSTCSLDTVTCDAGCSKTSLGAGGAGSATCSITINTGNCASLMATHAASIPANCDCVNFCQLTSSSTMQVTCQTPTAGVLTAPCTTFSGGISAAGCSVSGDGSSTTTDPTTGTGGLGSTIAQKCQEINAMAPPGCTKSSVIQCGTSITCTDNTNIDGSQCGGGDIIICPRTQNNGNPTSSPSGASSKHVFSKTILGAAILSAVGILCFQY